jgi:hypothetical protein
LIFTETLKINTHHSFGKTIGLGYLFSKSIYDIHPLFYLKAMYLYLDWRLSDQDKIEFFAAFVSLRWKQTLYTPRAVAIYKIGTRFYLTIK